MKSHSLKSAVLALVVLVGASPLTALAEPGASAQAKATFAEVQRTLGVVPAFIKEMPDENVAPFWSHLKALQLNPNTALSGRVKELIGLGVAAQVPCRYCVYAHGQFAKLNGASEHDLKEAVATAGLARELSTLSNGPAAERAPATRDELSDTYREIEKAFGGTPDFLKRYPADALVSLWSQMKAVTLNGSTALSVKDKALISLAVAAQLPSPNCVKDYAAMARANQATEQEIQEAIAMSGLTRAASTVLNGTMPDEAQWRRDIDQVVRRVKSAAGKKAASAR